MAAQSCTDKCVPRTTSSTSDYTVILIRSKVVIYDLAA